ncbi:extracellular solute-binding protein [Mesotoga sp.]|uniref:sugar ABC transporter substrate-binding protein n=1 Tax=Mesotoga sp. TaxID=2053577 RepID=UPI00345ED1D9
MDGQLIIWADDTRTPIFKELAREYTEMTGIIVTVYEMTMDAITEQVVTASPAGEGPDLIVGAHDWIGRLVRNGTIAAIDLPEALLMQFDPVTIEAMSFEGKLYGVPYSREGVALLYNKDLVPEPPKTWDELVALTREITNPAIGQYGFIVELPFPYNSFPVLSALGGYIFGQSEEGTLLMDDIGLDSVGMILGATLIDWLIEEGLMPGEIPWETMTGLLRRKGWNGNHRTLEYSSRRKWRSKRGVAPIPTICGQRPRPFVGVSGHSGHRVLPQQGNYTRLYREPVCNQRVDVENFEMDPRPSAFIPAFEETKDDPIMNAFAESISFGMPLPNVPEMNVVWSVWNDAMTLICNQTLSPHEALKQAAQVLEDTFSN